MEDRAAARQKAGPVAAKLPEMKLADAARLIVAGIEERVRVSSGTLTLPANQSGSPGVYSALNQDPANIT
jgi:hypothetical protein